MFLSHLYVFLGDQLCLSLPVCSALLWRPELLLQLDTDFKAFPPGDPSLKGSGRGLEEKGSGRGLEEKGSGRGLEKKGSGRGLEEKGSEMSVWRSAGYNLESSKYVIIYRLAEMGLQKYIYIAGLQKWGPP